MFKNFIVALDGSECAMHALQLALSLAKAEGSNVTVCSVADPSPVYGTAGPPTLIEDELAAIHAHAEHVVDDALEKARAAGITTEGIVLSGEPVYEIVSYATKTRAEAIVVGTHGRSGFRRFFIGSIAEGVLRSAAVPVLTVRAQAQLEILPPKGGLIKILVPVDGSECSLQALDIAADFAGSLNAEIIVCHVVDLAKAARLSGGQAQLVQGFLEELQSEGKTILAAALARAGERVTASSRIAEGIPVDEIERLAADIRPSFIVIGSHRRTGISRLMMGSVAEGVVRGAPIPVMVVPSKQKQPE